MLPGIAAARRTDARAVFSLRRRSTSPRRLSRGGAGGRRSRDLVNCPDLYDRDALYGASQHGLSRQRAPLRDLARAALELAARERRARRGARARLAGGPRASLPPHASTLTHPVLGGTPSIFTIHNLIYRASSIPTWLPGLNLKWDLLTMDRVGILGSHQPSEGRHRRLARGHDRQPPLCRRRFRRRSSAPDSTASCAPDATISSASSTASTSPNGIRRHNRFLPKPFTASKLPGGRRYAKLAVLRRFGLPDDDRARGSGR